jgi:hypothetical protein
MTPPLTFHTSLDHGPAFVMFGGSLAAGDVRWWWRPFRARGFEHVFAILPMLDGSCVVNGLASHVLIDWSPYPAADCALTLLRQFPQMSCVRVVDRTTASVYVPFEPMTCVTVVKAIFGIRAPWVVSPKGLHDLLLRRGAERFG